METSYILMLEVFTDKIRVSDIAENTCGIVLGQFDKDGHVIRTLAELGHFWTDDSGLFSIIY